jgi:hypothetical protein
MKTEIEQIANNCNLVATVSPYMDEDVYFTLHSKNVGLNVGDGISVSIQRDTKEVEISMFSQKFDLNRTVNFSSLLSSTCTVVNNVLKII